MQKYQILGVVGEGAYGVVLRCRHIETKEVVAIKKFKESEEDPNVKKTTIRQVKVLKLLDNENIVKLKEAFRKKGIVYLVFEYVNNNLLEVLENQTTELNPEVIRQIIYQVLKGLAYLHSLNIVHRDIKPQNLLVSDKTVVKICDFGFARTLKSNQQDMTDYVATRWYRAPQLLVGAPYSKKVDMWALGCIFGQLIDGLPMFPGENELDQLFLIQKCLGPLTLDHSNVFCKNQRFHGMRFPQIHSLETIQKRYLGKVSQKGIGFIKSLLKMEPAARLSAVGAIKHPYFDGIREDEYLRKLSEINIDQNRVTSACQTGYQKKRSYQNNSNQQQQRDYYPSHASNRGVVQIKKKEDTSRSSNLKASITAQHSKSTNKNTGYIKKAKDTTLSLQKHHNRDLIIKTQAGFFISSSNAQESKSNNKNKIYGGSKLSPKSKSKEGSFKSKGPKVEQRPSIGNEYMNSTGGLPFLVIGNQSKKGGKRESQKVTNINIVINQNTWVSNTSTKQV